MTVSIIPESAPFNEEQRAWLNGFLAGWVGIGEEGKAVGASLLDGAEAAEEEEDFPWHDASLEMDERLALADGKPMNRRMMAAMAQLNCGACGYLCQTYSEAIATGEESNLTLCSPGGKDTAKMLKKLSKEEGAISADGGAGTATADDAGYSRKNPYSAAVLVSENINHEDSSKITSHVEIDFGDSGLTYNVGDALGVYPTNCPDLVDQILEGIGDTGSAAREALIEKSCLRNVTDELLEKLAAAATDSAEKTALTGLIDSDELDDLDVLDVAQRATSASIKGEELAECLNDIAPRLYSIASSIAAHPNQVHLTIGRATYKTDDRLYKGVTSTLFSDRIDDGGRVGVYVHASHGFTVPADPKAPMIMVGPGTGIAPFRAFLEERQATKAEGKNWLFFGDQHAATDFLYEEQLTEMVEQGYLPKLTTAFSRDQEQKIYVQDRMREEGAELYAWLEEGGYFFVCGDARRMAVDVDKALHEVIATQSGKGDDFAKQYVEKLKSDNRYVRDVY